MAAICPREELTGQMEETRTESSRLTQAANNLILKPGSPSEWFQMDFFGAILIVLAKSLCLSHKGLPPPHLSLAQGRPLRGGFVVPLGLQDLLQCIASEAVVPSGFFSMGV